MLLAVFQHYEELENVTSAAKLPLAVFKREHC